ncbi:FAD-binding oxidoreductase [Rhodococcus sp. BP-149]|uniref:NAD(P)/FAD-dependent oxidoreductase n=1 Tax=unclassified Rhodococcus (in: high G+C Gram-positive bacteria) TaxID=192944 RepID=UPI001C9AE7AA|nr:MULTISPECIES: FAD-binding oxidoreductase [unclassified Rhodococcus (in: high G+C Gram-positive bacteria)]MBY6685684.1 FAD-binding oxidoreductase [Rhodococcus sp. BP-288]MBY6694768.1 FAD-binding oxidoreductase [Rhodococcus sp. BP-188]MBY6696614.1 FAD-binding oxidoreductase [Rhodococcus sp. BP-285]MBY6703270.1 FAD-binding oxidoreductase [Rhodococcus sp. BP-283]MBY6708593.1 FAD-binding oxidoreductase [Rhodococcus sp. BP-241]
MAETTTYLIIGGGLEGLAIAWSLADRGETDVLVVERNTVCSGMTGKSSGVVRAHYGNPSLAAMSWYGVQTFERATELFGDDMAFQQCGYVVGVGADNVEPLRKNVAMMQSIGVDVELIDHDAMGELWPGLHLDDFAAFAYEPRGGRGEAYMAGMAFGAAARRLGVKIRQSSPVAEILTDASGRAHGVRMADGGEIHAQTVILATGPWAPALAEPLGFPLDVRAQRAQLVMVDQGAPTPVVPVLSDLAGLSYICREPNGELLVGNSDHQAPEYIDPDKYVNRADSSTIDKIVDKMGHRLPDMPDPRITSSYVGAYDVTPDYNPIIGPSPVDGLFLATGFSGHGYKMSPAVGALVADLVTDGTTSLPNVDPRDFRYSRFAENDPLLSLNPYAGAGEMR